ncbi:MAG: hypothetical protein FWD36_09370 [Treponema sp.]|nr:hypothetical protein [Treponema sp.]
MGVSFKGRMFFIILAMIVCGCSTIKFNSFEDNQTYHSIFAGIWTSEGGGIKSIREFRNDGIGHMTTTLAVTNIPRVTTFKYKTSGFEVMFYNDGNKHAYKWRYRFEDNNTLIFISGNDVYRFHRTGDAQNIIDSNVIINALKNAADTLRQSLERESRIAIITSSTNNYADAEFVSGELELLLVHNGFFIVDRNQLDEIRREQIFQLSGDVDDNYAVSIGKIMGASVIIVCTFSGSGDTRRLRLRALNTETARVVGAASEPF